MSWLGLAFRQRMNCPGLGVRRLSSGTAIPQVLWNHAAELAKNFLETGDSRLVSKDGMAYSKVHRLFAK